MSKDDTLQVRIESEEKAKFVERCHPRNHSDVMREFIVAFNNGRLRIKPTKKQKELYDE